MGQRTRVHNVYIDIEQKIGRIVIIDVEKKQIIIIYHSKIYFRGSRSFLLLLN